MYDYKPCAEKVDDMVKEICIRNTVYGCVDGKNEEHYVGYVVDASLDSRDHSSRTQSFYEEDVWHNRENVVMR